MRKWLFKKIFLCVKMWLADSWIAVFALSIKKSSKNLITGIAINQKSFLTFAPGS